MLFAAPKSATLTCLKSSSKRRFFPVRKKNIHDLFPTSTFFLRDFCMKDEERVGKDNGKGSFCEVIRLLLTPLLMRTFLKALILVCRPKYTVNRQIKKKMQYGQRNTVNVSVYHPFLMYEFYSMQNIYYIMQNINFWDDWKRPSLPCISQIFDGPT